jgi:uroporphyrinogen decarboxylase
MDTRFTNFVLKYPGRLAMPIGVYAGLEITAASVRQAVSDAGAQSEAVLALHERFHTPVLLTAMDLSAEAETFGCTIRMSDEEIPTVLGRKATTAAEIAALPTPQPGDLRTAIHLQSARNLVKSGKAPVLGGMIGPFSLAGRIFGVSEALEATANDADTILVLLEKVTVFLTSYAKAFHAAGASGLILAEPAAGLLSPRGLAAFSAPFVSRIIQAVQSEDFTIIYHNCGAKIAHLLRILEMGAAIYHFGQPMDLPAALELAQGRVFLAGNLDPTAVFHAGTPDYVRQCTSQLLELTRHQSKYIISSGCDLPPGVPVQNLDAFYQTVKAFS